MKVMESAQKEIRSRHEKNLALQLELRKAIIGQGWKESSGPFFNDADEIYTASNLTSYHSPNALYYINFWKDMVNVFVMRGDTKAIVGVQDVLLNLFQITLANPFPEKLIANLVEHPDLEFAITELLVGVHL